MHTDNRFIHTRTGEVIEITGTDAERSKIVTITATGRRINARSVKTSSLKTTINTRRGTQWASAYVALRALPDGHPMAPEATPETDQDTTGAVATTRIDLKVMSESELFAYGRQKKLEAELATELHNNAKKEVKRRMPGAGLYINGDIALALTTNIRFDPAMAKGRLTEVEYSSICVPKPDASRALEILGEDRFFEVCKDHGLKAEIRTATASDRERALEQKEIQAAALKITMESFIPEDAHAPF